MAGSFKHCERDGTFAFDLIENMGDAHEACHQMFWMIHILTNGDRTRIAEAEERYYEMMRGERPWPATPNDATE